MHVLILITILFIFILNTKISEYIIEYGYLYKKRNEYINIININININYIEYTNIKNTLFLNNTFNLYNIFEKIEFNIYNKITNSMYLNIKNNIIQVYKLQYILIVFTIIIILFICA